MPVPFFDGQSAMADLVLYCNAGDQSTTGYYAVAKRPQNAAVAAGQLVRQFTAPAVGSERVFVCIVAGTTANTTDATWTLTRGAKTTDGTATWMECTGQPAVNGDAVNTGLWVSNTSYGLGTIIKRANGASYQICTTAGFSHTGTEPAFSDTAGVTTADGAAVWTSLGPVGNFTGGQAPFARLSTVFSFGFSSAANNIAYVGDNHAESQTTALTITSNSSNSYLTNKVICHNHSGSYPPAAGDLATGATVSTTAAVAVTINFGINFGTLYIYGLTFASGVGQSSASNLVLTATNTLLFCENCVFKIANTSAVNSVLQISGAVLWNNCQVSFGTATVNAQYIDMANCNFTWQNTGPVLASGSSVPGGLFGNFASGRCSNVTLEALDLSQINTGIFGAAAAAMVGNFVLKDCKLHPSVTVVTSGFFFNSGQTVHLIRCDSGAAGYKSARYNYEGTETTESSITRVGGARDPTGQAQSRKIVTNNYLSGTVPQWVRPFRAEPYAIWNPTVGADVTVTVYGTINAGALPNNDDIWMDVEYFGSSSSPVGTIVNTTKANLLAANAAVASDGSTWNGGGSGAGWLPFKLTKTLSSPQPGMAGYIHVRPRAAKPSMTFYLDPQITLS
jgi:hypothetical protein